MKQLKLLLSTLLVLFALGSQAQFSYEINGYVQDSLTGEPLVGVHVSAKGWRTHTYTNAKGYYSLSVPPQDIVFQIDYPGYALYEEELFMDSSLRKDVFLLRKQDISNSASELMNSRSMLIDVSSAKIDFPVNILRSTPQLAGEADLFRNMQLLPGIQGIQEGVTNLYVRGGSVDQNLITLDGAAVYNQQHIFGYFSTINPTSVQSVHISKGGQSARLGGRLSSFVEITTHEGSANKFAGDFTMSPAAMSLRLSGKFSKKTTFSFSARRSFIDVLMLPAYIGPGSDKLNFFDVNTSVTTKLTDKDKLTFSFNSSGDSYLVNYQYTDSIDNSIPPGGYVDEINGQKWNSISSSVNWQHIFGKKLFSNISVGYSNYKAKINYSYYYDKGVLGTDSNETFELNYFNGLHDASIKADFEYSPVNKHQLAFGVHSNTYWLKPGNYSVEEGFPNLNQLLTSEYGNINWTSAFENAVYLEDNYKPNLRWWIRFGARLSTFNYDGHWDVRLEPRLSARYLVNKDWSVKLSYARNNQYLNYINYYGGISDVFLNVWVPSTQDVPGASSDQITLGIVREFDQMELNAEVYYKTMTNLISPLFLQNAIVLDEFWENDILIGDGLAYGADFWLKFTQGTITGWLGYSYSKAQRKYPEINTDFEPFLYNREHTGKISLHYRLGNRYRISTNIVVGSGITYNLPTRLYRDLEGDLVFDNSSVADYKSPFYRRMDLALTRRRSNRAQTIHRELSFHIYNVLAVRNISTLSIQHNENNGVYTPIKNSEFLFFPGLYYRILF